MPAPHALAQPAQRCSIAQEIAEAHTSSLSRNSSGSFVPAPIPLNRIHLLNPPLPPILTAIQSCSFLFNRGVMGRAIFISYRRDDTEGEAGRLFDDLTRSFGENSVFMDVDGINPGMDFRKAIDDNVSSCGVLLAMIGPTRSTIKNNAGERRLDAADDFFRLEIPSARPRNIAPIR